MTAILIVLSVCLLVSLFFSGIAGTMAWRCLKKNFELQDVHKEYKRFHSIMFDTLEEDTQFMKSEMIRRLSMDLPETRAINGAIIKFQNRLEILRTTLKEYKMIED